MIRSHSENQHIWLIVIGILATLVFSDILQIFFICHYTNLYLQAFTANKLFSLHSQAGL